MLSLFLLIKNYHSSTRLPEERFTRFFNVIYCPEPSDSTVNQIVTSQTKNYISKFARAVQGKILEFQNGDYFCFLT